MTRLVPTISKNIGHFWPKSYVLTKSYAENTLQNFRLMTEKIRDVAALIRAQGRPVEIEVDGGIGPNTIAGAFLAGAEKFVVGSALWRARSFSVATKNLHSAISAAESTIVV